MVDTNALVRAWLLSINAITTLLGTDNVNGGIYCGDLPESFTPANSPAIQILSSGGSQHPEITVINDDKKMIRVWANVNDYLTAHKLDALISSTMHGATNLDFSALGYVMRCQEIIAAQDVTDPDTGWATVVSFYNVMAR